MKPIKDKVYDGYPQKDRFFFDLNLQCSDLLYPYSPASLPFIINSLPLLSLSFSLKFISPKLFLLTLKSRIRQNRILHFVHLLERATEMFLAFI